MELGGKAGIQDEILSLRDLTAYLSCSRTYAATMIADGTIPSFEIGPLRRVRRFDVDDECIESRLAARDEL